MSDFGDFDEDDAFGTEPADPEQVARLIRRFRFEEGWDDDDNFDALTDPEKLSLIVIARRLLETLRRQGSNF